MKRLAKVGIVAVGAALVAQAAQASYTFDDLYLGINQSGANDYVIDLGQASALTGSSTVVDLTSSYDYNTFNSLFTVGSASMGVVGGKYAFPTTSNDIWVTALPGTDLSAADHSQGTINSAMADLSGIAFPTAGNSAQLAPASGWTAYVTTLAPGSFYGDTGLNPSAPTASSLILNLYQATGSQGYTYEGYFTLSNPDQSTATLTFTPAAVPEPTTCALIGGGSLLLLAMRRRSSNIKA